MRQASAGWLVRGIRTYLTDGCTLDGEQRCGKPPSTGAVPPAEHDRRTARDESAQRVDNLSVPLPIMSGGGPVSVRARLPSWAGVVGPHPVVHRFALPISELCPRAGPAAALLVLPRSLLPSLRACSVTSPGWQVLRWKRTPWKLAPLCERNGAVAHSATVPLAALDKPVDKPGSPQQSQATSPSDETGVQRVTNDWKTNLAQLICIQQGGCALSSSL